MDKLIKKEEYIIKYSVTNSNKLFKGIKTSLKAYQTDCETIGQLKKKTNEQSIIDYLSVWIINLIEFLSLKNSLNSEQIQETAYFIISDYPYLKISDLYLIFTNIKKGKYGQFYESINGLKIMSIFEQYCNERAESIYESGLNDHLNNKSEKPTIKPIKKLSEKLTVKQ